MVRFVTSLLLASLSASLTWAAGSCSADNKCPEDMPCCSQYGQCGKGAKCLGGCDPLSSFSLDSCAPAPVCQNKTYTWDNLDNIALNTKYLGDASKADWVYSGKPKTKDGNLVLTMEKNSVGTLLANNHYIWYGKVSGKVKSSRGRGVVTAFILMSDVKDEIDYEFLGYDLDHAQTNYYFQGIPDWNNGGKSDAGSNTFDNWHTYEIDWQPDYINWSLDGKVIRTLKKEHTWNATANRYQFPQTPSRLQMSLWPAGIPTSAKGTIDWAGGMVDWDSEDIQKYGYYYAMFSDITVECYGPPPNTTQDGDMSYIYKDDKGLNTSVAITGNDTALASFEATGTNMAAGKKSDKKTGSKGHGSSNGASIQNEHAMQTALLAVLGVVFAMALM